LTLQRLKPGDWFGVGQYGSGGGEWVIPFQSVAAEREPLVQALTKLSPLQSRLFEEIVPEAAALLTAPERMLTSRHLVLVSAADPSYVTPQGRNDAVAKALALGVECTTVGVTSLGRDARERSVVVAPRHRDGEPQRLQMVGSMAEIPALDFASRRRVPRPATAEQRMIPRRIRADSLAEALPQELPPLYGYCRAVLRENPLVELWVETPPDDGTTFPLLASWRYGLGKSVAFLGDARSQPGRVAGWDRDWASASFYQRFWTQLLTSVLRETEQGKLTLQVNSIDDRLRIQAQVSSAKGELPPPLQLSGRLIAPDLTVQEVLLRPRSGGEYTAELPVTIPGGYRITVRANQTDGTPFDIAQRTVTVPYSREFADTESNIALLRQLAATGQGNYRDEAMTMAELPAWQQAANWWRPVPLRSDQERPLWPSILTLASVLLLGSVAVQRLPSLSWPRIATGTRADRPEVELPLDRLAARKRTVEQQLARPPAPPIPRPESESVQLAVLEKAVAEKDPSPPSPRRDDPLERLRKARDRAIPRNTSSSSDRERREG
jgi:hypothetical protein